MFEFKTKKTIVPVDTDEQSGNVADYNLHIL